jgi:hypothetical protein
LRGVHDELYINRPRVDVDVWKVDVVGRRVGVVRCFQPAWTGLNAESASGACIFELEAEEVVLT